MARQATAACCVSLAIALVAGCGDDTPADGGTRCLTSLDAPCVEAYPPTWSNIYEFTIQPKCGTGGGIACHGRDGLQGGLALFSESTAYQGLVGGEGGQPRVIPGDPACSELLERVTTTDPARRMPLGAPPLSDGERCAIQKWIAEGSDP